MIQLGDKVRFVNENLEGIVTSVKGNKQIGVTIDGDFEIPVMESEVIKIEFQEKSASANQKQTAIKAVQATASNATGVFFAYERLNDDDLRGHFHNNISDKLIIFWYEKYEGAWHLMKEINLLRNESVQWGNRKLSEFNKWEPVLCIIQTLFSVSVSPAVSTKKELMFSPKTFHNHWKHCFFLGKQAYEFRLDETAGAKLNLEVLKTKDFHETISTLKRDLKSKPPEVIDLHATALERDGFGTAADISSFQMEIFTATLEAAYVHHMKEIVFIHGVGNAWLKNKIRTYISKHKDLNASCEDADVLKYGGGATRIWFGQG